MARVQSSCVQSSIMLVARYAFHMRWALYHAWIHLAHRAACAFLFRTFDVLHVLSDNVGNNFVAKSGRTRTYSSLWVNQVMWMRVDYVPIFHFVILEWRALSACRSFPAGEVNLDEGNSFWDLAYGWNPTSWFNSSSFWLVLLSIAFAMAVNIC